MLKLLSVCLLLGTLKGSTADTCERSITKVSGTKAPRNFCAGDLIWSEDFNDLDLNTWKHELGANYVRYLYTKVKFKKCIV